MDLGEVKVAVGLDVALVRGIVADLHARGTIPEVLPLPGDAGTARLDAPTIEVDATAGRPVLVLGLTGSFTLGAGDPTDFAARVELEPFVRPVAGAAPVAALRVGALIEAEPAAIGLFFTAIAGEVNAILDALDIPLFDPLIAEIEGAFFGDDPPSRDAWAAGFGLHAAGTLEHIAVGFPPGQPGQPRIDAATDLPTVPALVATLALPGEDPAIPGDASIVPAATGIQILIAEAAMNAILAAQAAAKVGETVEGATIRSLTMRMHELGIEIRGRAEKDPATIDWDGILLIFFAKRFVRSTSGAIRWSDGHVNVFASGVDVDVNVPWWVTLLRVALFLLGPVGWVLDATLVQPKLKEGEDAPGLVRSAFRRQVTEALGATIANVAGVDAADAPLMVFGHDAWVLRGHYATSLVAFAGLNATEVTAIEHDTFKIQGAHGQSVGLFTLATGHVLHPEELGRLMKAGIVRVPGLHGVEAPYGFYVRSNPNRQAADNLVDPALIRTA